MLAVLLFCMHVARHCGLYQIASQAWTEAPSGELPVDAAGSEADDWLTETSERCRPSAAGTLRQPPSPAAGRGTGISGAASSPACDLPCVAEASSEGAQSSLPESGARAGDFGPASSGKDGEDTHDSSLGAGDGDRGGRLCQRRGSSSSESDEGGGEAAVTVEPAGAAHLRNKAVVSTCAV